MTDSALGGRRRIWPVLLASTIGVAVLIGLGTWQMQRLAWKEGLIAQIAARTTRAPVSLEEAERRWEKGEDLEYLRVEVTGRFTSGPDNYYFTTGPDGPGYQVYAPFGAAGGRTLIVNRGYIPDTMRPANIDAVIPRPAGEITVTGLVRASEEPGLFTGAAPPDGRNGPWLYRGLFGMAAVAHLSDVVPFFLDQERDAGDPDTYPRGGTTRLELPNRHLEYALTWYGLAAALAVVTGVFLWPRRQGG